MVAVSDSGPELPRDGEVVDLVVAAGEQGERLDRILSARLEGYSRSAIQRWIEQGRVLVDGQPARSNDRPRPGSRIAVTPAPPPPSPATPQEIDLAVLHEDEHLLVIDKPAGLVVHPSPGHPDRTLVNALLFRYALPEGGDNQRPGIVHRLDKDTSGVMVAARSQKARESLIAQFKRHSIGREYLALVIGRPPASAVYDTLYGRHPVKRKQFTTRVAEGKRAVTHMRLVELLHAAALVSCRLETGRTHQVRVHLSEHGLPVVADRQYGRASRDDRLREATARIGRQALHAAVLGFDHPASGERVRFTSPLPEDFRLAMAVLRD